MRRQLLALVLALVLVWYTLVIPAGAFTARRPAPDEEGGDGEVRAATPRTEKSESQTVEELDWPEYIYP